MNLKSKISSSRVLLVAPQPFFSNRGTPINVRAVSTALAEAGFSVDLLVFPFGEDVEIPGVTVYRSKNPFGFKNVPIGPSWTKVALDFFLAFAVMRLVFTNKYRLIHGVEEGGVLAWLFGKMRSIPFIYDADSDMPAQLEQKRFLHWKPVLSLIRWIESRCLRDAAAVITVCPALTQKVHAIAPKTSVYEIRDFAVESATVVDTELRTSLIAEHKLRDSRVLLYTGNLQSYQGLDLLLLSLSLLSREEHITASLKVIIVGGGEEEDAEKERYRTLAFELGIHDMVHFLGHRPIEQMGTFLSLADVLLSPRSEGNNTPLKIYSYMEAERPIVATAIEAHTQVLNSSNSYLAEPNPSSYSEAIKKALSDAPEDIEKRKQILQTASDLVRNFFTRKQFAQRVQGTYYSIIGVPSNSLDTSISGIHIVPNDSEVLVTGAAGFVGTELVKYLRGKDIKVRAAVRNLSQAAELHKLGAEVVEVDITDRQSLDAACRGISEVYHIAALFRRAGLADSEFYATNVEGTRNVLEASTAAGVKKVIHCSTVGVHGDVEKPPGDETTRYAPGDIYQQTKMEGEILALDYFNNGKINGAVIRPAMIYGPGDARTLKLFKNIARGTFFYVGSGSALVHFVDVRDLAHSFYLAMKKNGNRGEVYIIAGRDSRPLKELAEMIAKYFDVKPPWLHIPVRPMQWLGTVCEKVCTPFGINPPIFRRRVDFFTKNRSFNCEKAKRELGYEPSQSWSEELQDICSSYVSSGLIVPRKVIQSHAVIIRDFDGEIRFWSDEAASLYGWSEEEVLTRNSHTVFNTLFRSELSEINDTLLKTGYWEGELVHTSAEGKKLVIQSTWKLLENPSCGRHVVELSQLSTEHQNAEASVFLQQAGMAT